MNSFTRSPPIIGSELVTLSFMVTLSACTAKPAPPTITTDSVAIATYNIRHGAGMDDSVSLERTATALHSLNADIIGLQEVDELVNRSGNIDEAARLGELLDMDHAFGSFFEYDGGQYGMAILSRYPIVAVNPIRLPDGEEPRIALTAKIRLPQGDTITVVNVHFDWIDNDSSRFVQANALATHLDTIASPWLLLGDFNDVPDSRTLSLFRNRAVETTKPTGDHMTFPSTEPVKEIDYIFWSDTTNWILGPARVVTEPMASDHRPVVSWVKKRTQ